MSQAIEQIQPQAACLWYEAVARGQRTIPSLPLPCHIPDHLCEGHTRLYAAKSQVRIENQWSVEMRPYVDEIYEAWYARAAEIYKEKLAAEEKQKCSACSGRGHVCSDPYHGCPVCKGTGLAASSEGAKQELLRQEAGEKSLDT